MRVKRLQRLAVHAAVLAVAVSLVHPGPREAGAASTESAAMMAESALEKLKPRMIPPRGAVAAVKDGTVYISNEAGAAVEQGRVLTIVRETETITHPVTGEKLGTIEENAGAVRVVSADDRLITAEVLPGGGPIREGDRVKAGSGSALRVVIAPAFSLQSLDGSALAENIRGVIGKWEGVQPVSVYVVERFLHDEGIDGYRALADPSRFPSLKSRLGADYLILLEIREENEAVLMDASLFDLGDGRKVASSKGFAKKTAAPAPAPPAEKRPRKEAEAQRPPSRAETMIPAGSRARTLRRFDGRITALAADDLDGDGEKEIIAGFDGRVAVYEFDGERLELSWEKKLESGFQVVGLQAVDAAGDGVVEVYVNSVFSNRVSSFIFERGGSGAYGVTREGLNYLFYAGEDGRLYGQRQNADNGLKQKILALGWKGGSLTSEPFLDIPDKSRLSGIHVLDIDNDGRMDAAGFDYQHSLVYYSSRIGDWVKTPGEYGGSNMTITVAGIGDVDTYHQFQPALAALPGEGEYKSLLAVKNEARVRFTSSETFTRSRVALLAHDGMAYYEKAVTPKTAGVINGAAVLNPADPALALIGRSQTSFLGPDKSELILVNLDRY
ncbi:MAG: FG-GAP repeat domain-containing protein [Candidatus Nitrospinota bacterium M3_3B_026]